MIRRTICSIALCTLVSASDLSAQQEARDNQIRRGGVQVDPSGIPVGPPELDEWAIPALAVPNYRPKPSELLREGAFVHRKQGRLFGTSGGGRVFVFDAIEGEPTPAPMILMPSIRLAEMERVHASRDTNTTFLITGKAYVYKARNYLLPRSFTTLELSEEAEREPEEEITGGDETVDLINALRAETEPNSERPRRRGNSQREIARDGEVLTAQQGRVRRSISGGWEFVTDNGAEPRRGQRRGAAPAVLLPCLLLESIEPLITDPVNGTEIVMSGMIHVYDGESYLLPSAYRLVRRDVEGLSSGR